MDHVLLETIISNQIKSYRGYEFQEFGDRLLSKLYPDEYTAVRPGGPWGDLKNDGYCYINRNFFHFYGTSQYNVSVLKTKITKDVEGCLKQQQQVKKIIYVTNDSSLGVIETHIDALRLKHGIDIETWGPNRLVEMMKGLPLRDLGSVLKLSLNEVVKTDVVKTATATEILYSLDESSIEIITKEEDKQKTRANFQTLGLIALILFFLYFLLPWGWFIVAAGFFSLVALNLPWHITVTLKKGPGGEYQRGVDFYIPEGDHHKRYRKKALCSYPGCNGLVHLDKPPEHLKKKFKVIGYCSSDPTHHTFTYTYQNTGVPVTVYTGEDQYASETDRVIAGVIKAEGKMKATETYQNMTGHTLSRSKDAVDAIASKYAMPVGGDDSWDCIWGCASVVVFILVIYLIIYIIF